MVLIIISPASVLGPSAVFSRVPGPPEKLTFAPPASPPQFGVKCPSFGTIVKSVVSTGALPFSDLILKCIPKSKEFEGDLMNATGSQMMSVAEAF